MKKMDMKTILFLVLIFFLSLFSFILLVGYLLNEVSKSKGLQGFQIAISFVGIFSTFGGAYLGAKISGENAIKLAKKEKLIDDMIKNAYYDKEFITSFVQAKLKFNIERIASFKIKNSKELSDFTHYVSEIKNKYNSFLTSQSKKNLSNIIDYEYSELFSALDNLYKECDRYYIELIDRTKNLIKEEKGKEIGVVGNSWGIGIINDQYPNKIIFENKEDIAINENFEINENKAIFIDLNKFNNLIGENELNKVNEEINNLKIQWKNITFKEANDIRDYIISYYKE
ncbi:hypothetical protein [Staphylococcus hominis]|uniref:hypothetical protein n=1 Tax=Staphylococcus hominis TaxID=1290 RepID=UPI00080DA5EB|nr:hypothetical protein [Staphylococcus hominis]